jgi:hypothetical protein
MGGDMGGGIHFGGGGGGGGGGGIIRVSSRRAVRVQCSCNVPAMFLQCSCNVHVPQHTMCHFPATFDVYNFPATSFF